MAIPNKQLIILFLIVLGFCQISIAGTTGKIMGRVIDEQTGEALAGANVTIENTALGAATDLDGNYVIIGLPPGTYTATASYISYREMRVKDVEVNIDKGHYIGKKESRKELMIILIFYNGP